MSTYGWSKMAWKWKIRPILFRRYWSIWLCTHQSQCSQLKGLNVEHCNYLKCESNLEIINCNSVVTISRLTGHNFLFSGPLRKNVVKIEAKRQHKFISSWSNFTVKPQYSLIVWEQKNHPSHFISCQVFHYHWSKGISQWQILFQNSVPNPTTRFKIWRTLRGDSVWIWMSGKK